MMGIISDENAVYKRRKHPFSAPIRYQQNGLLHKFFQQLVTKENVESLGFFDWNGCKDLIADGIVRGDSGKTRKLFMVAQLIILGQRFGVKKAQPEYPVFEKREMTRGLVMNGSAHKL